MDNVETMSMDELRALVEQNLDPVEQEQPRDEQGRFVKPAEPVVEEETVYQRIIDLGDGSGTQVFEGKTLEELVEKLATAQEHATRKIREQAQALKTVQPPPKPVEPLPPAPVSESEKWLLQQRMMSDPQAVIGEFVTQTVKQLDDARLAKEQAAATRQEQIESTARSWVDEHPDYYGSAVNGAKMEQWLKLYALDPTPENFTKAFDDLRSGGLLETGPKETPAETEEEAPVARRIVEPVAPTTVRRKVVGGLSTRRSAPVEPVASGPTEDELYKMPMDDLKQLMYRLQQS